MNQSKEQLKKGIRYTGKELIKGGWQVTLAITGSKFYDDYWKSKQKDIADEPTGLSFDLPEDRIVGGHPVEDHVVIQSKPSTPYLHLATVFVLASLVAIVSRILLSFLFKKLPLVTR